MMKNFSKLLKVFQTRVSHCFNGFLTKAEQAKNEAAI